MIPYCKMKKYDVEHPAIFNPECRGLDPECPECRKHATVGQLGFRVRASGPFLSSAEVPSIAAGIEPAALKSVLLSTKLTWASPLVSDHPWGIQGPSIPTELSSYRHWVRKPCLWKRVLKRFGKTMRTMGSFMADSYAKAGPKQAGVQ